MRVGLVTDFYLPWIGGPAGVVHALGHGLAARGHAVSVLAPSPDGPARREQDSGFDVWRASTKPLPFGFDVRVADRPHRDARAWLRSFQPDVVHVHHPFPISASAAALALRREITVVATNHTVPAASLWGVRHTGPLYSLLSGAFGAWIAHVLQRAQAVATPTETAARQLRALGYRSHITVISNGVDTEVFRPGARNESLARRLGLDSRPVVLYTGRLDAEKQMDVWLDAAQAVCRHTDSQFVIGGKGTEQAALAQRVQNSGLRRNVRFVGYLERADFAALYRLASVYFITSPVELQSISTLEALASGLPVVAVDAGALPELVHDKQNGYLVAPGDAVAAARAIQAILSDEAMHSRFAEASRAIATTHDLIRSVEQYERWIEDAWRARSGDNAFERVPFPGR